MNITIYKACYDDVARIYQWRFHPKTMKYSPSQKVSYQEHYEWFKNYIKDKTKNMFICYLNHIPACVIRFDEKDGEYITSIYLNPSFHGMGLGMPCLWLGEQKMGKGTYQAYIDENNMSSIKLFSKMGYIKDKNTNIWKKEIK